MPSYAFSYMFSMMLMLSIYIATFVFLDNRKINFVPCFKVKNKFAQGSKSRKYLGKTFES